MCTPVQLRGEKEIGRIQAKMARESRGRIHILKQKSLGSNSQKLPKALIHIENWYMEGNFLVHEIEGYKETGKGERWENVTRKEGVKGETKKNKTEIENISPENNLSK